MLKNMFVPLMLLVAILFHTSQATPNKKQSAAKPIVCAGIASYADTTMASLQASGTTDLNKVAVLGSTTASGRLTAEDSTFATLRTSGSATLQSCKVDSLVASGSISIKGSTITIGTISGNSELTDVTVHDKLTTSGGLQADNLKTPEVSVCTKKCTFNACKITLLIVKPNGSSQTWSLFPGCSKKQETIVPTTIYVRGATSIDRIIFENCTGTVELEGALATVGNVQGGQIQRT